VPSATVSSINVASIVRVAENICQVVARVPQIREFGRRDGVGIDFLQSKIGRRDARALLLDYSSLQSLETSLTRFRYVWRPWIVST